MAKYLDDIGLSYFWNKIKANVLTLSNTTSFTPSADYQPATKKYVDDNIGGATNLTLTTLDLGSYRISYNSTDNSLDIEVI